MSQNEILYKLKNGDRETIKSLYDTTLPKVNDWIMNNQGNREDALDIFQETMETILLKVEDVHTSIEGLLIKMAKYKWIDKLRKRKKEGMPVKLENIQLQDEGKLDLERREREYSKYKLLDKYFNELSPLCQKLMLLLKQGTKIDAVVKSLNFSSANTLYRRKAACLQRWSELIKKDNDYNSLYD